MKRHLIWFLALAACEPKMQPIYDEVETTPVDACGAAELADLVGEPKSVLATMKFAVPVRVIEPGMAVTADYQTNRLNFEIGDDGLIADVACY